jgi:hypothetical protein
VRGGRDVAVTGPYIEEKSVVFDHRSILHTVHLTSASLGSAVGRMAGWLGTGYRVASLGIVN